MEVLLTGKVNSCGLEFFASLVKSLIKVAHLISLHLNSRKYRYSEALALRMPDWNLRRILPSDLYKMANMFLLWEKKKEQILLFLIEKF